MTTTTQRRKNATTSTDPRPKTIRLGIDREGSAHYYRTRSVTIHVIASNGTREYVFDLARETRARKQSRRATLSDYMDHVTAARGWASKGYCSGSLVDQFTEALDR